MKQLTLLAATALLALSAHAQDYKPVLQKTVETFDTTSTQEGKVEVSNKLGLIAKKWDKEWITHYYNAFSKTMLSLNEKGSDKRDAYLDEADIELADAVSILGKDNSETYTLAGMIANARISVSPMNRYQKYGKIFSDDMDKAKELNPGNPRIYFLQGEAKFHTPKAFGGGKKSALPYFEKAATLFDKETSDDIAKPYWGKKANADMIALCKGDE